MSVALIVSILLGGTLGLIAWKADEDGMRPGISMIIGYLLCLIHVLILVLIK